MAEVKAGSWVEIYSVILEPGQRAPQVPEDTAKVPLELKVKGFLQSAANLGDEVEIETIIGRKYTGKLIEAEPSYDHSYGRPIPELLKVGQELKEIIKTEGGNG